MKSFELILALALLLTFGTYGQSQGMFMQDVSWSPDGKYLAFTGMHDIDPKANMLKADIYVVKVDGTNLRKITGDEKNDFYTGWEKGRVVFSSGSPGGKLSDIYSAKADGSDLKRLTNEAGKNTTPAISRDGKRIAFVSTRDGEKYQIFVMDSIGYFNPQFSPDGKRILYYAEKGDGKDQIWVMNADGSNQTLLTANIGHNIFPGWSPDGKRIIFSSSKRDADSGGSYVDGSFLYIMNADGSGLAKLGNINTFFARFSPDGKKIAYVSGKFPTTAIYIANADGSGASRITK